MSPRTEAQNTALRAATREKILGAALRLFSRQGYDGVSIRDLAKESGLALGLLYSHFQGKRDLLQALFRRSMEDVRASFAAAAAPEARNPLAALTRAACAILRANLDFWRLSYGLRMQEGVMRDLGPELEAWTREILKTLERPFRKARSKKPGLDAALFFASWDGVCQHFAMDPDRVPLEVMAEALVERFSKKSESKKGGGHESDNLSRRARGAKN